MTSFWVNISAHTEAISGKDRPTGYVAAIKKVINEPKHKKGGAIFEAAMLPVFDGIAGHGAGQMYESLTSEPKVQISELEGRVGTATGLILQTLLILCGISCFSSCKPAFKVWWTMAIRSWQVTEEMPRTLPKPCGSTVWTAVNSILCKTCLCHKSSWPDIWLFACLWFRL